MLNYQTINGGTNMSTSSKARQRIESLLDENSFVEIGAAVTARNIDFDLKQTPTWYMYTARMHPY